MKVFVAGGGGAIGARLLPQLIEAGHEVAATARSPQACLRSRPWARRESSWMASTGARRASQPR